ncbi:MAG TPA: DUF3108 domain-containing protein [Rhizomicrobium sp.]|nr:DUF3108 domain-containing protein [Rhizomicrobium sp.]
MRKTPLLLLALLAGTPAFAEPTPRTLEVSYSLSFWGVDFGHIQYSNALKGESYAAKAHFETLGMVGFFWKSLIDATADGGVGAHSISPVVYDSHSRYRDRPLQQVKLTYANDGDSVLFDPPVDSIRFPVTREEQKGAIDPMSALISMLVGTSAAPKTPCGTGAQVFDGRRRYDVQFTYVKDEKLSLNHGLYQGSAHLCELHFVPIAGYPQRLIMDRRDPPKMFADFIDVAETGTPNGRYVMPVKVWAELTLGTVTATLDTIDMDGEVLANMTAKS